MCDAAAEAANIYMHGAAHPLQHREQKLGRSQSFLVVPLRAIINISSPKK
jgi:hypothetical protein